MWNLVVLSHDTEIDMYIVMTPDGATHCIDKETKERFEKEGRLDEN